MFIQAKSLKEYEDFIEMMNGFIESRENMLKSTNDRISIYNDKLITSEGKYNEYCKKILDEEKDLFGDINIQLNNAKKLQEELIKSYEKTKLTMKY